MASSSHPNLARAARLSLYYGHGMLDLFLEGAFSEPQLRVLENEIEIKAARTILDMVEASKLAAGASDKDKKGQRAIKRRLDELERIANG